MISNKIRKAFYQIYTNQFKKYNTLNKLKKLKKIQWESKAKIERYQFKKLKKILNHAKKRVPYYSELLKDIESKELTYSEFQEIPFLTKNIIRSNFDKLISKYYTKSDLISSSTSGSTGNKLNFFKDKKRRKNPEHYRAPAVYRNIEWTGVSIWDKKVKLWGLHHDISKYKKLKNKLISWITNSLFLSAYDLKEDTMKYYIDKINKFKPKLIISQPSVLYTFAKYIDNHQESIFSPTAIILSAETLYPYQRKLISNVFNSEVFNRYGCREFGAIAHECFEHKGLHINAERLFVEIINENGELCEPGEMGEIVVTDLDNYGFPFIRYKIGDIGVKSDNSCKCGRGLPLLESVEGRKWDIIVCPNGNYLTGTFWLVEGIEGIKEFQVIQEDEYHLLIKIIPTKKADSIPIEELYDRVKKFCGRDMNADIRIVNEISRTQSGKRRPIISKVSPFD